MPKDCGIISLRAQRQGPELQVDFAMAHVSASMAFAYWQPGMSEPRCVIDRTSATPDSGQHLRPRVATFGSRARWKLAEG